jgi:Endoribonuclease L-PSP
VAQQTERVLENLKAILTHAGLTLAHIVKTTVFLKDMNDFAAMNEVYAKYFPVAVPAGSTVQAAGLPKDALVEIVLDELGIECQVGDAAKIRAAEPRKQKHDRRDAELILKLLVENRFPAIWKPSRELLDLRALLLHRHHWVRLRTQVPRMADTLVQ